MSILLYLFPAAVAAILAFALTPLASRLALRVGAIDVPSARKSHVAPTPRLGGVAVVAALLITLGGLWWLRAPMYPQLTSGLLPAIALGLLPVFVVSCWDDIRPLSPWGRLIGHVAGAAIAITAGLHLNPVVHVFTLPIPLGMLALPLSVLWIVGVTNAFNLIDGLDGLSAGLGLISAASLALVAILTQDGELIVLSFVVLGALAGFIPFNLHPARVFLGDSGATAIGFCLACLTLSGGSKLSSGLAVLVPLLAIGVPVADTLLSIVRRVLRGLQRKSGLAIFRADSEHVHHQLLRLGLGRERVVLILYGVGVTFAGVGIASLFMTAGNSALLLAALLVAGFVAVSRLGYDEFAVLRSGVALKLYDTAVIKNGFFKAFVDIGLVMAAFYGAVALKYDDWELATHRMTVLNGVALMAPITLGVFWTARLHARAWRFAGIDDVISVNAAIAVSSVLGFFATRMFIDPTVSGTLFAAYTMLLMLSTSAGRASFRVLEHVRDANRREGRRVVLLGADARGLAALREIRGDHSLHLLPIGFIDDDPALRGARVGGLRVLGTASELDRLIHADDIQAVLFTSDRIAPAQIAAATQACLAAGVGIYRFDLAVHELVPHGVQDAPGVSAEAAAGLV